MTGQRAQDDVERALQAARCDDCIVIADETSSANLRWAGNTLTTNGVQRSRQLTVIAISPGGAGPASGWYRRRASAPDQIEDLVAEAASRPPPTRHRPRTPQPLIGPDQAGADLRRPPPSGGAPGWDDPASGTEIGVLGAFAETLGAAFEAAAAAGRRLYGFAEHSMTSLFLGSSTGLRLRHDQPTGTVELNAKSADLTRSAWAGAGTRDFTDVAWSRTGRRAGHAAGLGRQADSSSRPAVTRPCCPPPPSPTCSSTCTGQRARRTRSTAGPSSASRAAAPGSASGWPACR